MTKQILVNVFRHEGALFNTSYVVIQDDSNYLFKNEFLNKKNFEGQAQDILELARKHSIHKIMVDTRGLGLGLFESLAELVGVDNSNRQTGEINSGIKFSGTIFNVVEDNSEFIVAAYKRALESINDAIEDMRLIQRQADYNSTSHRKSLESQIELEKTKLELIRNEENTMKASIFECPTT